MDITVTMQDGQAYLLQKALELEAQAHGSSSDVGVYIARQASELIAKWNNAIMQQTMLDAVGKIAAADDAVKAAIRGVVGDVNADILLGSLPPIPPTPTQAPNTEPTPET